MHEDKQNELRECKPLLHIWQSLMSFHRRHDDSKQNFIRGATVTNTCIITQPVQVAAASVSLFIHLADESTHTSTKFLALYTNTNSTQSKLLQQLTQSTWSTWWGALKWAVICSVEDDACVTYYYWSKILWQHSYFKTRNTDPLGHSNFFNLCNNPLFPALPRLLEVAGGPNIRHNSFKNTKLPDI